MIRMYLNECRRFASSAMFYVAIILTAAAAMASSAVSITAKSSPVVEMLQAMFSGTGSAMVILLVIPVFPYALSYAFDERDGAVLFWVARADRRRYAASRFLAGCTSAFGTVVLGFFLFALISLCMGHSMYMPEVYSAFGRTNMPYTEWLGAGHPWIFILLLSAEAGLSAAMGAGFAMLLSGIYPNPYLAFCGPLCAFFLVVRLFSRLTINGQNRWLSPSFWIEGGSSSDPWYWFFGMRLLGAMLVCAVYGLIFIWRVGRRWRS